MLYLIAPIDASLPEVHQRHGPSWLIEQGSRGRKDSDIPGSGESDGGCCKMVAKDCRVVCFKFASSVNCWPVPRLRHILPVIVIDGARDQTAVDPG